jgi:IclR family acetate operon transcriptional repressor
MMRKCGYATDNEENAFGVCFVASAIFEEHGEPFAAMSRKGADGEIEHPRSGMARRITKRHGGRPTG